MANSWWNVTGKYTCLNDKGKKVKERFRVDFQASSKTDAVNQAKKYFEDMKRSDPSANYDNFTSINAKPVK